MRRAPIYTSRATRVAVALVLVSLAATMLGAHASEKEPVAKPTLPLGPPPTRVDVVRDTLHGVVIQDPYRWLEDKESAETRAWAKAQMAYTQSLLGQQPGREALHARLEQLLKIDQQDIPVGRGGRYFYNRRRADQDLSVLYVREGLEGRDQVLVDPHPLAADHSKSVSLLDVSQDGKRLAYGIREGGQDEVTVHLLDVDSRQEVADALPKARYFTISFTPDKKALYYSKFLPEGSRTYYHVIGTDPSKDELIFGADRGPSEIGVAYLSEDGRWLTILVYHGSAGDKVEVYVQDTAKRRPIQTVVNDLDAYFEATVVGDKMVLLTNWQAPNRRVMVADLANLARSSWKEIVPSTRDVIDGVSLAGGRVFVNYLHDVSSNVKVFDLDGKAKGSIEFPTLGSAGTLNGRWQSDVAFFDFQSFGVPRTIYRYDVTKGTRTEWWRAHVPVAIDQLQLEQIWYASKDGTRVPMFILHRKGLRLDGTNPTYLTGYGGFNVNNTPWFSAVAALWAEMGGVFALPNLRGGAEFGEAWHKGGMLGNKQNTFDDFIAASEWLIQNRYTSSQKIAIQGGSNGGLLVGAAMTQRPELFQAVVCEVPLLDMLRFHRFLVARFWVPEYGSSEDAQQFKWLYAYSPYQHVQKGVKYPAVLFVTGDSDTRVDPLHARKMAALMQASTGSERPVLLHYDTTQGHSGGKPVSKEIEDTTDELSFLLWQLGMKPPASAPTAAGTSGGAAR